MIGADFFLWCSLLLGLLFLGWLASAYLRNRLGGFEDRFMALYGKEDWEASNMELVLTFPLEQDAEIKALVYERLEEQLATLAPSESLLHETAEVIDDELCFVHRDNIDVAELYKPRKGVWLKVDKPGEITVVWSHIQADGLRVWRSMRPIFDENPHILPFAEQGAPFPIVPELAAVPSTLRTLGFDSNLCPDETRPLERRFRIWSTAPIKALKNKLNGSFNLVATSMLLEELFQHHPEADKLTVGLTVAFPFLEAKNKYGVATVEVKRGDFSSIYEQLVKQVSHPMLIWGSFSNQSLALALMPDSWFMKAISHFRGKIDVLVSNLPVGKFDVEIAEAPVNIACHTDDLTIPYYFLLLGTKSHIHLSCTTKFGLQDHFLEQERVLSRIDLGDEQTPTTLGPAVTNRKVAE